jgi:hypothetical protein
VMAATAKTGALRFAAVDSPAAELPPFFTIGELSARWRCSRGSVYNWLRGSKVVDFAPARGARRASAAETPGVATRALAKRHPHGRKLVPRDVVLALEEKHTRTLR